MSTEDMDRRMALRSFGVRVEEIRANIRGLPLSEKFRVVGDFLDSGQTEWAREAARIAMAELDTLNGGAGGG
jgi:hypothetical protein